MEKTRVRPEEAVRAGFDKLRHQIAKTLEMEVINGSPSA